MILAVIDDLIFLSKVQHTAHMLGVSLEVAAPTEAEAKVRAGSIKALLIDLNHNSGAAVEVIRRIKADPATGGTRIIGYLSHVRADLAAAARAAGCDMVLARSRFVQLLPALLK